MQQAITPLRMHSPTSPLSFVRLASREKPCTHREGRAEKITELSGNPKAHMDALTKDSDTKVGQDFRVCK